jgi:hypothetical protein
VRPLVEFCLHSHSPHASQKLAADNDFGLPALKPARSLALSRGRQDGDRIGTGSLSGARLSSWRSLMRNIDVRSGFEVRIPPSLRGVLLGRILCLALVLFGAACTLITDVDRERIPVTERPPFPEVDAGRSPDASAPDEGSDGGAAAPGPEDAATSPVDAEQSAAEPDSGALDAG